MGKSILAAIVYSSGFGRDEDTANDILRRRFHRAQVAAAFLLDESSGSHIRCLGELDLANFVVIAGGALTVVESIIALAQSQKANRPIFILTSKPRELEGLVGKSNLCLFDNRPGTIIWNGFTHPERLEETILGLVLNPESVAR